MNQLSKIDLLILDDWGLEKMSARQASELLEVIEDRYQVNSTIKDEVALFTRLNIGKIPLTNAELVKALFLSKDEEVTQEKQLEISTSWDIIERDLQHNDFWSFLSNVKPEKYATRIELIFDLMANKPTDEKEKFYTFFYFSKEIDKESKLKVWKEIQAYYLLLKELNCLLQNKMYHKNYLLQAFLTFRRTFYTGEEHAEMPPFQNHGRKEIKNF